MSTSLQHIAIVGRGNVGHHLQVAWSSHLQVSTVGRDLKIPADCDLIVVCVPDDHTLEVIRALPLNIPVAHTAGAITLSDRPHSGVLYPLYSFSKTGSVEMANVPFLIEANSEFLKQQLFELATLLSDQCFELSSQKRKLLHISAVLVNNFTNHLYTIAFDHAKKHELPEAALYAIMKQGPEKAIAQGPAQAQTGPARRGDWGTIEEHLNHLDNPELKELYRLLSERIYKHHNHEL
jgi:predicted short-subunit dehydrogenase-like oxidoreductase (DUF2520 family)